MVVILELKEVEERPCVLEERQQHRHLHCPHILLGLGQNCSSAHFDCCQLHSSQPHCCDHRCALILYPCGEVRSEVIILCLPFDRQLVEVQVSRVSWPSNIKTLGWCRKLKFTFPMVATGNKKWGVLLWCGKRHCEVLSQYFNVVEHNSSKERNGSEVE